MKAFRIDPQAKAAFELAHDDHEGELTEGEFLALILSESKRVKGWGI